MSRGSLRLRAALLGFAASAALSFNASAVPITADAYSGYVPGDAPANYQSPANALGNLNGNTTFGGLNPFNPAFSTNDLAWVGQGGSLTLHLSSPVAPNGMNLGVYSNVGIAEAAGGIGTATSPAQDFNQPSVAVVSVSQDGVHFVALNGGNPITFANPTNYYTDTAISGNFQPLGTAHASQSKPFLGNVGSFSGSTYDQIKGTLNNSAGGTWLDVSNAVPSAINYVKFDVAAGSGNRMIIDAIGGLGAVNALTAGGRVISESVGTGASTSDVVVDYGPQQYDFKVHYNTTAGQGITVEQALQLLQANSDFRFTVKSFSFGDLLTGVDYGGYLQSGTGSNGNDYWSEMLGDGAGNWQWGNGISSDTLSDGSYVGLTWAAANPGNPAFAIVPEPTMSGALAIASLLLIRRRRRAS